MLHRARLDQAEGNAPPADPRRPAASQLRSSRADRTPEVDITEEDRVYVTHGHVDHYARRLREHCDRIFPPPSVAEARDDD